MFDESFLKNIWNYKQRRAVKKWHVGEFITEQLFGTKLVAIHQIVQFWSFSGAFITYVIAFKFLRNHN